MTSVFGYYTDVPELDRFSELKLVCLWRARWQAAGIEPVVLSEWDARQHPYFEEYDRAISALPSVNPAVYERACWLRWLALARAGGGYLADFDLIPYLNPNLNGLGNGIPLRSPEDEVIAHIYQSCAPSLAYADKPVAENLCREFAKGTWGKQEINGREHWSDMYMMAAMPDTMVRRHDIVKGYGDDGWETAPFVHYSNGACGPRDRLPKWKHIPKLRK